MDALERESIVEQLSRALGDAHDVTPADGQPLHVLFATLELPEPWRPSPTRALTVWQGWPVERPQFVVDESVVGEGGEPPRSNNLVYLLGESWRQFSFSFPWSRDDPVRAVQLWMSRFEAERN
jgi:hypothetical protein